MSFGSKVKKNHLSYCKYPDCSDCCRIQPVNLLKNKCYPCEKHRMKVD